MTEEQLPKKKTGAAAMEPLSVDHGSPTFDQMPDEYKMNQNPNPLTTAINRLRLKKQYEKEENPDLEEPMY